MFRDVMQARKLDKWLTPEERDELDSAERVVRQARKKAREFMQEVRLLRNRARKRRDTGKEPFTDAPT